MAFYSGKYSFYYHFFSHIFVFCCCCWVARVQSKVGKGWNHSLIIQKCAQFTTFSKWLMIFRSTNHRHSAIFRQQMPIFLLKINSSHEWLWCVVYVWTMWWCNNFATLYVSNCFTVQCKILYTDIWFSERQWFNLMLLISWLQ